MHRLRQAWWGVRALLLIPFFGRVGWLTYIGPTTLILNPRRIYIGRRVRILPGLRAEAHGAGRIDIGSNVAIGQQFHIAAGGDLRIGEGTLISGSVTVTDMDHEYRDTSMSVLNQPMIISRTEIGQNCFIGAGVRIQAGTVLGNGCVVGANSVVRGSFPEHSVIVGAPARVIRHWNPRSQEWERAGD